MIYGEVKYPVTLDFDKKKNSSLKLCLKIYNGK